MAFNEIWKGLISKASNGEERAQHYSSLTGLLKGAANGTDPEAILSSLCQHHKAIVRCILSDITCQSCDPSDLAATQAATQALGYFIHSAECAKKFSVEQVAATVNGLCDVINGSGTSKTLCTRALWCLANQNFSSAQMVDHVKTIVTLVTNVLVSQQQATPTVDTEALNLFVRLCYQCPREFMTHAHIWYKALVSRIFFSKTSKLQRKALSLVSDRVDSLRANTELIQWLCCNLKESTVSVMLSQLNTKGVEYGQVLDVWGHFIAVLGQALHRHGSFLNEMLRVVELGFKHRSMVAQETAYSAWKQLIANFALDHVLLTSRKRLKLLLMPLLRSAVKEKTVQVEEARIKAWWYLIHTLGSARRGLFTQVCIPFLLLCLGLDPKLDIGQLSTLAAPLQGTNGVSENAESVRTGLFALVVSGNNQFSVSTPTLRMMLTGCHGIMKFTGSEEAVSDSLITLALFGGATFPDGVVTMEIAWFLLLYLEGLATYLTKETAEACDADLNKIIYYLFSLITNALMSQCEGSTPLAGGAESHLLTSVLQSLGGGGWRELMCEGTRRNLLSNLTSLPAPLLARGHWRGLVALVMEVDFSKQSGDISEWLTNVWTKIVQLMGLTSDPLAGLLYLSDQLGELAGRCREVMRRLPFTAMWSTLAQTFSKYVTETTKINHGTDLNPNFRATTDILKFPLFHLLYKCDKSQVREILEVWRTVYDMAVLHISLVVKEPNHCAHLVSHQLYLAYKEVARDDRLSLETKFQTQRFDLYQNAIARVVSIITSKIQWAGLASLQAGSEDRARSVKKLLSLLAWQLARFCDGTKKSPVALTTLTTPYTLHQVLLTFFRHLPTFDLLWAGVENLAEPLAGLWSALLHSPGILAAKAQQRSALLDEITSTWLTVTTRLRSQGPSPFPAHLLSPITPLLVATLTSDLSRLVGVTLNFWVLTFDQDDTLTYPPKLVDAFQKCFKSHPRPHGLRLPNLKGVAASVAPPRSSGGTSVKESAPESSEGVVDMSETQPNSEDVVVLPHEAVLQSPHRRVCSSFLGKGHASPSPHKPHPLSPGSKALEKVLSNHSPAPGSGAQRRLHMPRPEEDKETYVPIPAAKRTCLLTQHQQEKQEESSDLPPMYNSLDDHTPQEGSSVESPIIIPESEVSLEATPTTTPSTLVTAPTSTSAGTTCTVLVSGHTPSVATAAVLQDTPPLKSPPTLKTLLSETMPTLTRPPLRSNATISPGEGVAKATTTPTSVAATVKGGRSEVPVETMPTTSLATPTVTTPAEVTPMETTPITLIVSSAESLSLVLSPVTTPIATPTISAAPCVVASSVTTPIPAPTTSGHPASSLAPPLNSPTHPISFSRPPPVPARALATGAPGPLPPVVIGPLGPGVICQVTRGRGVVRGVVPFAPGAMHPAVLGDMTVSNMMGILGDTFIQTPTMQSGQVIVGQLPSGQGILGQAPSGQRIVGQPSSGRGILRQASSGQGPGISTGQTSSGQGRVSPSGHEVSTSAGQAVLPKTTTEGNVRKRPLTSPAGPDGDVVVKKPRGRPRKVEGQARVKSVQFSRRGRGRGRGVRSKVGVNVRTQEVGVAVSVGEETEGREGGVVELCSALNPVLNQQDQAPEATPVSESATSSVPSASPTPEPISVTGEVEVGAQAPDLDEEEDPLKGCGDVAMDTDVVSGPGAVSDDPDKSANSVVGRELELESAESESGAKVQGAEQKSAPEVEEGANSAAAQTSGTGSPREQALSPQPSDREQVRTPQSAGTGSARQKAGSTSGILKHVSQFDTPSSARGGVGGRRVQFASKLDFKEAEVRSREDKEGQKTPRQGRGFRSPHTQSFSSRRTLQLSHSKPLPKPHPSSSNKDSPIFPSLISSSSPVDEILPALLPASKFTHGLLHLVRARNITTVGQMSSLTEKQVQMLPIKSPKVLTLRTALTSFLHKSSRRRTSSPSSTISSSSPFSTSTTSTTSPSTSSSSTCSSTVDSSADVAAAKPHPPPVRSPAQQDKGVAVESGKTTPTCGEDSFMLESDPNMTSPTHPVTLTTPESQSESQEEQVQTVKHDHTYSLSNHAPSGADMHSVVVSVKENTVSVKRNVIQRGVVTEGGVASKEKGVVGEEQGVVGKETSEVGVVSEEKGVADESGSMLSQELFSEEEGVVCEVTCAQEKLCVWEDGGVVSSAHLGEVMGEEMVGQDIAADQMVCSSEAVNADMELGKVASESDNSSVVPGMELEQMELGNTTVEPAVSSGGGAEGVESPPVEELVPPLLNKSLPSTVSGVAPPSSSSTTPTTSATPPSGSGDQTVEQIIQFLPSCEVRVHRSKEVSSQQLHLLTNKLLNFIFTVNSKLETFTSK